MVLAIGSGICCNAPAPVRDEWHTKWLIVAVNGGACAVIAGIGAAALSPGRRPEPAT